MHIAAQLFEINRFSDRHFWHEDYEKAISWEALAKALQIARAASGVGEHDKRIPRSVDGAFEACRTNTDCLGLRHSELPYLVPTEVLSLG
jgi:hypothetical protein